MPYYAKTKCKTSYIVVCLESNNLPSPISDSQQYEI